MPKGKWEPPEAGNLPAEGKKILAQVYSDCRDRWAEEHPNDIENEKNKTSCSRIAWHAVENAGYKKKNDKWMKEEIELKETIKQENGKWYVYSEEGKRLGGPYDSEEEAKKRLQQIEYFKHKEETEVERGNERLRNSELVESCVLSEAQEIEPHVFRVQLMNLESPPVKRRGWSDNGKYYTDKALESLARLLNNKKSMASGHHDDGRMRETAAVVKDVIKIPEKKIIEGDYHILGEAQQWLEPLVLEQIKTPEANLVSLSINAGGSYFWGEQGGKRGKIVEDANYAEGCDAVFNPAAGGNFKKIIEEYRRTKMEKISLKELKEERPDLVDELTKESTKKIGELQTKVTEFESKDKLRDSKEKAQKLIANSKLTEEQAMGLLDLMIGKEEEDMKRIIEERKKFIRAIAPEMKITNLSDKDTKPEIKPLTESEKKICKQLGLTEEQFRTGRGDRLQESKPKTDLEKLQEQIDELKKKRKGE